MKAYLAQEFLEAIPPEQESSVVEFGRRFVRLIGSARSEAFHPDITPWTRTPIECTDDGVTRHVTFIKPVQSGGSSVGEIALCRWISVHSGGDIQYNWEDDLKAKERWDRRVEKILKACPTVISRWPSDRFKAGKGNVIFAHCNLTVQGVHAESNVASDSVRFQINEEIHNWQAGRLSQAHRRTTAFWNSIIVDISNAGVKGDQLHESFNAGTQEHWEVKCPGCGSYHVMRTRWDDKHPEMGGLRYDADAHRTPGGGYDYNGLLPTIRYQMPCGFTVLDDTAARRALSLSGRYGEPRNPGASRTHRSFTLEAISVDYIPWVELIRKKHAALRALKYGDPEPWKRYLQEDECRFWDPEDRPIVNRVIVQSGIRKNREGLPDRFSRFFAIDRQRGTMAAGELPHWWQVIRDVKANGDSLLVWEGKCLTDDDVIGVLREHGCLMRCGVADSSHDTTHVYSFCLRHGIHAIKGSGENFFRHELENGARRIFSPWKPLHEMIGAPPIFEYKQEADGSYQPNPDEPRFWFYSANGIRERLHWLRNSGSVAWEVPADVSEDYQQHMEAWELEEQRAGKSNEVQHVWVQRKKRDDLRKCEEYIALLMEMAGIIGANVVEHKPAETGK